ncbi:MAG TPA: calcium/sodium antiporter [Cellvibrio sp.]|nr:calcium/sodium antiporter [Cellvibrio sp.]
MIHLMWLLLGLVLLTIGGEALVRGALAAAKRIGISPLLAGLVIVGFGTSAPELVVSLQAALNQEPEIAVGNVVGSNIANILLILGLSALIMPLVTHIQCLKRDGLTMLFATLLFMGLASIGGLDRVDGVVLLAVLVVYLIWAYRTEREDTSSPEAQLHKAEADEIEMLPMSVPMTLLATIGGLAMLIFGANRFLLGAVGVGESLGVPDAIIGLTVVAVGTSLPELAVSIVAAVRKHADVAVGNIIGSNIFNILCILGISSLINPLPLHGRLLEIDQFVMLAAAVGLLLFLFFGLRLSRMKGALLLLGYVAYIAAMFGMQ